MYNKVSINLGLSNPNSVDILLIITELIYTEDVSID
jgi:hypothetical protein